MQRNSRARLILLVCLPLAMLAAHAPPARADYWKRIWGPVEQFLANDSGEYAVRRPSMEIYQRHKDRNPEWVRIGGPGREFVVTKTKLYGLTPDGGAVVEYTGMPGQWRQIGGSASHIYAGDSGLFATNPKTGDIWAYELSVWDDSAYRVRPGWTRVGGPGAMFAVGEHIQVSNRPRLFGLAPNRDSVWRYDAREGEWRKIGGPATKIWAGGRAIYATNPDTGDIFGYGLTHIGDRWVPLGGPARDFAVHQSGAVLYGLGTDDKVRQLRNGDWVVVGEPHTLRFDRIFAGFTWRNLKARERGTRALWSLEEGSPPRRERKPPRRGRLPDR